MSKSLTKATSIIDFSEIRDGETWELFARDFLEAFGFFIESPPDRGPDRGKDLLVTEEIRGKLHRDKFRWLVSCKHFAGSNRAVSENDEKNILERMESFKADGFIGFYSTIASSNLNQRLNELKKNQKIKDYKIFDHKLIEYYLLTGGYSHLILRYFPNSYKQIKPIHPVLDKYEPLECDCCGKDLLQQYECNAVIAEVFKITKGKKHYIFDIYCACKGKCDVTLESRYKARYKECITRWEEIAHLFIPVGYIEYIFARMDRIRWGLDIYSAKAYEKLQTILIKIGQRVFQYTSKEELELLKLLIF